MRVLQPVRDLWRYDLPRQVILTFVSVVALTAAIGWMISVLDQVTTEEIAKAEVRGTREGGLDGYAAGFERGRLDGAGEAQLALPERLESGDPAEAYQLAYDFAWNEAVNTALLKSKRDKLEVESAFEAWEELLRE